MQGLAFEPIRGVHRSQQQHEQDQIREADEQRDGERGVVEDHHMTHEKPNTASDSVGTVTSPTVPFDPVGKYLIPSSLLSDICP